MNVVVYRFEMALERSRKRVLPEIDLVAEFGLGDVESLGGDVDMLVTEPVCEVDEG